MTEEEQQETKPVPVIHTPGRTPELSDTPTRVNTGGRTEVHPLPTPLSMRGGVPAQRPRTTFRADYDTDEGTPVPSPAPGVMAEAVAARRRHQARMDVWAEVRAAVGVMFGVLCCLILVVAAVLVFGAMLGSWTVPMRHPGPVTPSTTVTTTTTTPPPVVGPPR